VTIPNLPDGQHYRAGFRFYTSPDSAHYGIFQWGGRTMRAEFMLFVFPYLSIDVVYAITTQ
jgi:hypothetical protein